MSNLRNRGFRWVPVLLLALAVVPFVLRADVVTTVFTDHAEYAPGSTVIIRGFDWEPGEEVQLVIHDQAGNLADVTLYATANEKGDIYNDQFVTTQAHYEVTFLLSATGLSSGRTAEVVFKDANPSSDLDQCANDPAPSPNSNGCSASAADWVNGNLGASKSVYLEGDSIPYRMRFDNLSLASHTVTIEWDTTKSGKHATDYLTTFNQTVLDANPCLGVASCNPAVFTSFAIPVDPQVSGGGVTPIAGSFRMYGATITGVSAYSYADGAGFAGDKSARISITFTASVAAPVLAWGGHISTRVDWGLTNSAVAIPGSPYHMRLIDLDGSGGNQDRSLSADAVIFPGSITVIKQATPEGSTSFPFTASPSPLSNFSLVDDGTSANTKVFSGITTFTNFAVSETAPSGWQLTGITCSATSENGGSQTVSLPGVTINLKEGENVTCTFTNVQQTGTLIVYKHVVNDDGGTALASDWSLHVKNGGNEVTGSPQAGSESGTSYTLAAGSYNVSETGGPSGYTFDGYSLDCGSTGNVTVVAGTTRSCKLTNNDQTAHLKLVKTVTNDNGGTAVAADWTLSASGPTPISGAGGAESDVDAGSYTLSESQGPAGYTAGSWSCVGGTQNGSAILLGLGESATCTINNNDNAAHLKLVKTVTNDNGGTAVAADWTLSAAGPTPISGSGGAESDVSAGAYALSESGPSGYTAGSWSCVGGTQNGASVTLALGQSATCTINNNDIAPKLHLRKVVVNDDGGTKTVADFTLTANGAGSNDLSGTSPVDSGAGLQADTWALSETNVTGYTASAWSCVGGTQNGSSITVGIGGEATCTITNNDQTAHLKLVKTVTNDNGGTAVAADWTLQAAGPTPISGAGGAESDVDAGAYNLSESAGPAGYTAGSWNCVGGTQNGASVTLALGQSATCTINNNDIAPKLHLRKVVVNNNGGSATVADFTLTANGTGANDLSGTSPVDSGAGLKADTWALSETNVAGYTASAWNCVGGTQNGSNITVGIGGEATCTITNDDQAAHVTVVKVVINNNGGTAGPNDFALTLGGNAVTSGVSVAVNPGTYTAGETLQGGYAFVGFSGDCDSNGSVTVALGESKTCTLTNNDIPPKLHLRKVVINDNGGTKTVADFTLTANGTGANDLSGTSPVDSGAGLQADTWALSETNVYGYTASAWSCVGGTQNGSNITVGIGGEATCTITNDDQPGTIVVIKNAKPASGSFSFDATGTGYVDFTLNGDPANNGNVNTQTLDPGTYTVKETTQLGWILTGIGGSSDPNTPYNCTVTGSGGSTGVGDINTQTATISLKNGDTVTCTFENTGEGVTRTQGFWATHPQLAEIAWFGGSAFGHTFPGVAATAGIGDNTLCGRPIDTLAKVMGAFWSDISKKSTGAKRSALDQARMQLLQQLMAAELNASAFGSVPAAGSFAAWESAYCGTNQNAIKNAQQQAASFNTNGDSGTFTPGTSADSKNARAIANRSFWDTLP